MYKKCATCPKLGITCNEFDLLAMSTDEMREWCRWRLVWLGWTRVRLVAESNTPKSTIDRFFSNEPCDFKFETFRPIVKALIGGEKVEHPCPMFDVESDTEKLQQEKELLQAECEKLQAECAKVKEYVSEQERRNDENMARYREDTTSAIALLKAQMRSKNIAIITLTAVVALFIAASLGLP